MNSDLRLDGAELWHVAGWTMVHFLWLGTIVGIAAAGCRVVLRRASPNARYLAAGISLSLLAALPMGIAAWLAGISPPSQAGARGGAFSASKNAGYATAVRDVADREDSIAGLDWQPTKLTEEILALPMDFEAIAAAAEPSPNPSLRGRGILIGVIQSCVLYLPWIWFVGTPVTLVLLATGIVGTERLRRASEPIAFGPIIELSEQLRQSLRIGRRVTIAACQRVAAPVLVGILRPIILLPPAALSGWSPDEIEMVLLHELAHVRRWDNLVNLLQRLVESLLFFHPAVWLVSSWMRSEREACCDAIVVGHTNRRRAYAELLVSLASQQSEPGRTRLVRSFTSGRGRGRPGSLVSAMAAGPLRNRIRYILQMEDDSMLITGKSFALVLAGLLTAATIAVLYLPTIGMAEEATTEAAADSERRDDTTDPEDADDDADELAADEVKLDREEPRVELAPSGQAVIFDGNRTVIRDEPGKETTAPHEPRVLGTFPANPYDPGGLFRAVEEAHAEKLHVDIVPKEDKWELVVVSEPTESGWPALLGQPPRKERVIADKAWARLGLKLVPASRLERLDFETRRVGGPIKILGGNVPDGLPLPAFLRRVGNQTLESFDDLNAWLNEQEVMRTVPIKVYAFADGHEYLFDAAPSGDAKMQAQGPSGPSQKFPSLEDQRLADLAWRMLELELEPISGSSAAAPGPSQNEDLRRVKALGYSGGVLVTGTAESDGGPKFFAIQRGDILVGLHVWPTTSLKEVAEILTRDDLADLNPLKFYVVRLLQGSDKDTVVSGRITVRTFQPAGDMRWPNDSQAEHGGIGSHSTAAKSDGERLGMVTAAEPPPVGGPSENQVASVSSDEIKVLEEHVKTLESQFQRLDALYKTGARGGSADNLALAAYELAAAKGELALLEGRLAQAMDSFNEARLYAEDAFKAFSAAYDTGGVTYDVVVLASKNLAKIKRRIIQLQNQKTDATRATALPTGGARDNAKPFGLARQPEATPQTNESISVLKKFVEREKQQYERLKELAANNAVSTAEVATQQSNYEISRARLEQAMRALEYHKAMVALAAAEYETALEASKKAPGAVTESELRKLQLKVQAAEARFKELAE